MEFKQFVNKFVFPPLKRATIITGAYALGIIVMPYFLARDSKSYVEDNLEARMLLQEEKFNIKHFGMPNISFDEELQENSDGTSRTAGFYITKNDHIRINTANTKTSYSTPTTIVEQLFGTNAMHINEILDHELGHFYVDKLMESITGEDWPDYSFLNKIEFNQEEVLATWNKKMSTKIVSEGISQYFCFEINPNAIKPRPLDYKVDTSISEDRLIYDIGYYVVKPVIDKYRKEGIIHMASNLPTSQEVYVPFSYTRRMLFELEELEKK